MNIIAIASVDENGGIGYQGQLLERIPEDMKRFKELTMAGGMVIMGRNTWESMGRKPLPDRTNIVITSSPHEMEEKYSEGCQVFMTLNSARRFLDWIGAGVIAPEDVYIIGGASIYEQFLPLCNKVYLTKICKTHENVDTYFPLLDNQEWKVERKSELKEYNGVQYQFINYSKIDN